MINNDLFRCSTIASLPMDVNLAMKVMSKSSNKLIFILRDKTNLSLLKAVSTCASSNHIQRINLGLVLSKDMIENDIEDVYYHLTRKLKISKPLMIDNAEILFDQGLNIKPFQFLRDLARNCNQCLIVVLDAVITSDGKMIYGKSSSNDFIQYESLTDIYILELKGERA